MVNNPAPAPVRFERNIIPEGECWRWVGNVNDAGYGRFGVDKRNVRAHRWSYEYHVGAIPAGLELDHLCRNRWCVNPYHLDPVPHKVNTQRGEAGAWLKSKTHCVNGHDFTKENTIWQKSGRRCLECKREEGRRRYRQSRGTV